MKRRVRWLYTWGVIGLVAVGCARRSGNEPTELKRSALDPEREAQINGTVKWNGQPVTGLASQTLTVFIEGESFPAINPMNGQYAGRQV